MEEVVLKKILKKYGNTQVIVFTSDDCKIHGFEVGDILKIKVEKD